MEIFASHLYAEGLAGLRRRAILKKEKKMCTCFGMLAVCMEICEFRFWRMVISIVYFTAMLQKNKSLKVLSQF